VIRCLVSLSIFDRRLRYLRAGRLKMDIPVANLSGEESFLFYFSKIGADTFRKEESFRLPKSAHRRGTGARPLSKFLNAFDLLQTETMILDIFVFSVSGEMNHQL